MLYGSKFDTNKKLNAHYYSLYFSRSTKTKSKHTWSQIWDIFVFNRQHVCPTFIETGLHISCDRNISVKDVVWQNFPKTKGDRTYENVILQVTVNDQNVIFICRRFDERKGVEWQWNGWDATACPSECVCYNWKWGWFIHEGKKSSYCYSVRRVTCPQGIWAHFSLYPDSPPVDCNERCLKNVFYNSLSF